MIKQEFKDEIHLTSRMLKILEGWDWYRAERMLTYDFYGRNYEIVQMANEITGESVLAKTMYFCNDDLHRLDGPAYIFSGVYKKKKYYVNGREYTENEYNFFITGMME